VGTTATKLTPTRRRRIKIRKEGEVGRQKCMGGKSQKEKVTKRDEDRNMGNEGET
jgi:hypothetical protein